MINKNCLKCKKSFKAQGNKSKFCSHKCSSEWHRKTNHPNWVGVGKPFFIKMHGRYKISINGKKMIYARYLMEQHLNRKLKHGEVVHHINGKRNDDRIENLIVMTNSEHVSHHNPKTTWINTKCMNCGKSIYRYDSVHKRHFCSQSCNVIFNKPRKHNGTFVKCTKCGKEVYKRPCEIKHVKNPFCSKVCGISFNKHRLGTGKSFHKSTQPLSSKKM